MGRRVTLLLTWFSVALVTVLSPLASLAEPAAPPPVVYTMPTALDPPSGPIGPDQIQAVLIELAGPPAAGVGPDIQASARKNEAAQAAILQALPALGGRVLYQARLTANGIAVAIPAGQVELLRQLPGVARVSLIPPKQPAGAEATASADQASIAGTLAGLTGLGIRIGVIDRGVDYTHADFGGPGTPAAYTANVPDVIEPGSFPTAKVVGGYDFAGDAYNAGDSAHSTPAPDPDPLECNKPPATGSDPALGQGTRVAGIAAGFGVAADGTTYHGPYGASVDYSSLKVRPGVAPEAALYALKVFGCHGSTTLLGAAIERALDPDGNGDPADRLDVLLITLGTPFGSADDPDALAVDSAVRAGMVVVVAAGNTLSTFYSVSSPASARLAIAVGASTGAGGMAPLSARGPIRGSDILKPDLVAPGVAVVSAAVGTGSAASAMSGTAAAAPQVAGAAALLRQMHAGWSPAQIKAALMNSATPIQAPPSLAGAGQLNLGGLAAASVLAYSADLGSVGLSYGAPWVAYPTTTTRTLQIENTGAGERLVTLSATAVATETGVTITTPPDPILVPAHGTAQATIGLSIDPSGLEFTPDSATAPLQELSYRHYLAEHGGYIRVSAVGADGGTRVRPGHAAHFASVDFYLDDRLLDHSLDSREVQDFVSTTPGRHIVRLLPVGAPPSSQPIFSAPVDLLDGKDYSLLVVGRPGALGILVVDETVLAPPPEGQALLHFVNANRIDPDWNIGPLDVYLDGVLRVGALAVGAASRPYLALAPGSHFVAFYLAGADPAHDKPVAKKTFTAAAGEAILVGTGRHDDDDSDLSDFEQRAFVGRAPIRLVGGGGLLASVPFNVFPTVASDARVSNPINWQPASRVFSARVQNTGARNAGLSGTRGSPRTPLASAFELEARSAQLPNLAGSLSAADVQYLGVTSSYSVTHSLASTLLYFGMSTYAPWSTPNEVQFRIYIDSNRDGVDDFLLVNTNTGTTSMRAPTDAFYSVLYPLKPDGTPLPSVRASPWGTFGPPIESSINMAPFNTSVIMQALYLPDLALPLDPANPTGPKGPVPTSFCYHVQTLARGQGLLSQVVDRVPEPDSPMVAGCGLHNGVLLYDVANYAIAPINTTNFLFAQPTQARPIFLDVDGGLITGGVNPSVLSQRGAELLVLHFHNAPSPAAQPVTVRSIALAPPDAVSAAPAGFIALKR
ncbi:MAG: S8 family serine peptidase [Kouleothrix sp.]|nr:S8 family serine peptidase [Kouleothrix sp.]